MLLTDESVRRHIKQVEREVMFCWTDARQKCPGRELLAAVMIDEEKTHVAVLPKDETVDGLMTLFHERDHDKHAYTQVFTPLPPHQIWLVLCVKGEGVRPCGYDPQRPDDLPGVPAQHARA